MDLRIATPDCKSVCSIFTGAEGELVLEKMVKALKDFPQYNKPSRLEEGLSPFQTAIIKMELREFDAAKKILANSRSQAASFLKARIARYEKDWELMNQNLDRVSDGRYHDDVVMEKVHASFQQRKFAEMKKACEEIENSSKRFSESQYYLGIAQYHLGEIASSLKTWQSHIEETPEDKWVYRSDSAHSDVSGMHEEELAKGVERSILNRIGYLGKPNPDLLVPPKFPNR